MEIKLDTAQLTIGDVEDIEEICGASFSELNLEKPSGKLAKAIVYVIQRKNDPTFTLEDARNVKIDDLEITVEERPQQADGI